MALDMCVHLRREASSVSARGGVPPFRCRGPNPPRRRGKADPAHDPPAGQDRSGPLIELSHLLPYSTTNSAKAGAAEAVAKLLEAVSSLHDPAEGANVLVPDTNALIFSPAFEDFGASTTSPSSKILLVPTLLSELDSLKVEHRNPDVRAKANEVIRQIKYRRRGPLSYGVDVVNGRIRLRSVAVEPRVEDSLPWLNPTSQDDRMLASCLEAMRVHSRSAVILVTGDINLQNKAEFARVPFIEPPGATGKTRQASMEGPS